MRTPINKIRKAMEKNFETLVNGFYPNLSLKDITELSDEEIVSAIQGAKNHNIHNAAVNNNLEDYLALLERENLIAF